MDSMNSCNLELLIRAYWRSLQYRSVDIWTLAFCWANLADVLAVITRFMIAEILPNDWQELESV